MINPNEQPLDIVGISYSIELMDKELISGVTNDVPRIEGYAEGVVTLDANLQLFELLRLLASVGTSATTASFARSQARPAEGPNGRTLRQAAGGFCLG